jgi:TIR domain
MSKIFVSYRRGDTAAHAGRLTDRLRQVFGANNVFMDVTTLEPGVDFVDAIRGAVGKCEILIVVIGRDWVTATGADGQRRLDDPDDFVRIETASALTRSIRVVPVLVERAEMPSAQDLPEALKPLVRRNAFELRDARWDADVEALLNSLVPRSPSFFTKRSGQVWTFGMLGAAGALAVAFWWPRGSDTPVVRESEPAKTSSQQPAKANEAEATASEHEAAKKSESAMPTKADDAEAAKTNERRAPSTGTQQFPAASAKPNATDAPSTTKQPLAKIDLVGVVSHANLSALLTPVCPPKTAKSLYDFALPAAQRRGTWVWDKNLLALQTDAAGANPCGGSSVLRLECLADIGIDGGGAALDLTNTPGRDWSNQKSIHLALRVEARNPFDKIQIYVSTSNYQCTAEWTQAAPRAIDGTWFGLTFGLSKFDSDGPHRNDSQARCQLELGDVSLIGVKLFGSKATTTLSLAQLWLE